MITTAALRTIRRSALYDLIVTAPFATPWTARWLGAGLGLGARGRRVPAALADAPTRRPAGHRASRPHAG